ncbi:MAG: hypothetical protein CM1200mP26_18050 [Acidimicrobiales bacterium]|nr:MAG: hypothetical protein CM1200mP26_18050 [Acidimicrobiales bacterium]
MPHRLLPRLPAGLSTGLALAATLVLIITSCTSDRPSATPSTPTVTAGLTTSPGPTSTTSTLVPVASSTTTIPETSTASSTTASESIADGTETGDNDDGMTTILPEGSVVDGVYVDPRGLLFEKFQESFDRTGRFTGLDAFCRPAGDPPDSEPVTMESGISAESIVVVQIDTRLHELAKIGFDVPVGEPGTMVATFVGLVNTMCGGIHGRTLDLRTTEVSALGGGSLDIDTLREAACLEAVEIHEAAVVLAATPIPGTVAGCLTQRHRVSHLAVRGISDLDLSRGRGLLHSIEVGDRTGLILALGTAIDRGLLDGATIGVVVPDAPQRSDDVMAAVEYALAEVELTAARYQIGCEGTTTCQVGLDTAVAAMIDDGVDVVVPLVDMTSLPWLSWRCWNRRCPAHSSSCRVWTDRAWTRWRQGSPNFGGSIAGAYYDGALVVDGSATGSQRLDDAERRPFDRLCAETWAEAEGVAVPTIENTLDDVHRTVVEACSLVRWVARAAEAAGPDPSRLALQVPLANGGTGRRAGYAPHDGRRAPVANRAGPSIRVSMRTRCRFRGVGGLPRA